MGHRGKSIQGSLKCLQPHTEREGGPQRAAKATRPGRE